MYKKKRNVCLSNIISRWAASLETPRAGQDIFSRFYLLPFSWLSSVTYRKDLVREAGRRDAYTRRTLKSRGRPRVGSRGEFPW